jgi:putative PEP-CTERM system TPR-repeat lipoprotein
MAKPLTTVPPAPKPPARGAAVAPMVAMAAALLAAMPAAANMDRAQQALARGDLRTAQIEMRNAIRQNPQQAAPRAALAELALEMNDGDTAEREARAALERGFDPVAGTGLLMRAYVLQNRHRELLRDFPVPTDPARAALAGRIAAARALSHIALDDRPAARDAAAQAVRLAPSLPEAHVAASVVAEREGQHDEAMAAADRAVAADPNSADAVIRKASLLHNRRDRAASTEAAQLLAGLIARQPRNIPARVLRADALLRTGNDAEARAETDAVMRLQPNSPQAIYLHGVLLGRAGDLRGADEAFQRLSGNWLAWFPEGLLVAATARRAVGQTAQAEDLAQRFHARNPEDPRGARLLASLQLEANRPAEAIGVLQRLADRGAADAEAMDLLGRAYIANRRPRDAVTAFERAVQLAPDNTGLRTRLAAARLAVGDVVGAAATADEVERSAPDRGGLRELAAATAIARGDLTAAEAEIARLDAAALRGEVGGVLAATVRLGRLDLAGARQGFEAVLRDHPESIGARVGLARVLAAGGDLAGAERLWTEIVRRDPANAEALSRLGALVQSRGPRAASARAALEAAQAAAPTVIAPSMTLAGALAVSGDLAGAARVLESDPMRALGRGATPAIMRSQVYAAQERWGDAENEARVALAEEPENTAARRQLAMLMARDNRAQAAETLLQDGLRRRPADTVLQQALLGVVNQARGADAALRVADQLARQPSAQPTSRSLRGDFLMSQQRPADAAEAYAAAYAEAPSAALAMRRATALRTAGQMPRAVEVLEEWLRREPAALEVMDMLANLELQLGRNEAAERRLQAVVERAPTNAPALNNLAWLMAARGDAAILPQARQFAERGYYLMPSAQTADTLGWVLALGGDSARAVPLLRQAAAATNAGQRPDRGIAYRFAYALRATGERQEATSVLEAALRDAEAFPERPAAERLLADLRAGR